MRSTGKKKQKKESRKGRVIWIINLLCIGIIIICSLAMKMEESESGLTYAEIFFDREISQYRDTIPLSLLGLMKRNPETEDFVLNFPEYNGYDENFELIEIDKLSESRNNIPLFVQWDERWGYEQYGNQFLALTGCGPTCLSMVYSGLSGDSFWNPYETAKMSEASGFYVNGAGSSWSLMTEGAEKLGLTVHHIIFDGTHIKSELLSGRPIICSMGPGDFTTSGHFIVLSGVDDAGNIIVNDPNSILNSEKSWKLDQLLPQIKNLWSYSCDI